MQEGVGNEVPALEMTLLPPGDSTPGDLSQPGFQTSRVRFWIGEYDVDTGELDGTPDVIFAGQLDSSEERRVGQECVSQCGSRWSTYISNKKISIKHPSN